MKQPLFKILMEWENGELCEEDEVDLFQDLINSGMVWSLQGLYGRHAQYLIEIGKCKTKP